MLIKYNVRLETNIIRLINQLYRLLPLREEGGDWTKPLDNLIIDVTGLVSLIPATQANTFAILCKLEGLKTLTAKENFMLYRKTIFETLNLLNELKLYVKRS